MTKKGIIDKLIDKHYKLKCAKCGASDLSHSIDLEQLRAEFKDEIKKAANYDGDVYTANLLGEIYQRGD